MEEIIVEAEKEYKEIRNRRLNNFSQLQQFSILTGEGDHFFNIFEGYRISEDVKDDEDYISYYSVDYGDWWDTIAYKYYENENLWWIVAMTNDVINPFEELNVGEYVKVIDRRWIYNIVKEVKSLSR